MTKMKLGPNETLFPLTTALVAVGDREKQNIITIAWIAPIDNTPPLIMFSLHKARYSLSLIRKHKCFTINLADATQAVSADYCGTVSGRDVNKFERANFTPVFCELTGAPLIGECPLNLECRLFQEIEISDRIIIIGEVLESYADCDKVIDGQKPDVGKMNPLAYCSRVREYWTLGEKVEKAFECGRKIGSNQKCR